MQLLDRTLSQGTKVRRYNWHSAGSLGWPYIFQTKYTEPVLSNNTRRPLWFEITEMLIAVQEKKLVVSFIVIFGTFVCILWAYIVTAVYAAAHQTGAYERVRFLRVTTVASADSAH